MNRYPIAYVVSTVLAVACAPNHPETTTARTPASVDGTVTAVTDTTIAAQLDIAGVAEPFQQATLSTKLMGSVVAVLVREGDLVSAGQPLVRIDARDLTAKAAQAAAAVADAEANRREALAQATRIRALYADSAATKAQLDGAETGLSRAEAAIQATRAGAAELGAVAEYSVVRAPFAGVVTRRFVDAGAFAAPGAALVTVQDVARLRIVASTTPDAVRSLRRGATIDARIEGNPVPAIVEGVVPATAGNLYTVNAIVSNADRALLAGSAASLLLPAGRRHALLVPAGAVRREGDLTGVMVRTADGAELRWVRIGQSVNGAVEVTSGLRADDQVVVPSAAAAAAAGETERRN
jgi:RND family efflux transporter MFP subunit